MLNAFHGSMWGASIDEDYSAGLTNRQHCAAENAVIMKRSTELDVGQVYLHKLYEVCVKWTCIYQLIFMSCAILRIRL